MFTAIGTALAYIIEVSTWIIKFNESFKENQLMSKLDGLKPCLLAYFCFNQ